MNCGLTAFGNDVIHIACINESLNILCFKNGSYRDRELFLVA